MANNVISTFKTFISQKLFSKFKTLYSDDIY